MNIISPTAYIHPDAVIGDNNTIGPFCCIYENTVIGSGNTLKNGVTLHPGARIGDNNEIYPYASIATKPQDLKYKGEETLCIVGNNNSIREFVTLSRGTASKGKSVIGSNNLLMENVHIAHDCVVGDGCIIGNSTKIAGEVTIDSNAIISATVLCHQFCRIAGYVMIQGGSRFSLDIPPFVMAGREPTHYCGVNLVGLRRRGFTKEAIDNIHNAYRLLYSEGVLRDGIAKIKDEMDITPDIKYIIDFVEASKRGVIR